MRVRCDSISTLSSYKDARYEWETTTPWKNGDFNERPLDSRAKHHMTIRIGSHEEVICKLYHTDVVTYWPDGVIELNSYNTSSTDAFTEAILPSGIRTQFTKSLIFLNGHYYQQTDNVRVYQTNRSFRVKLGDDNLWAPTPDQEIEPFERLTVNRKRAKEALKKYDFARFQAWVIGYTSMNERGSMEGDRLENLRYFDLKEFMAAGPSEWLNYRWRREMEPGWGRSRYNRDKEICVQPQIELIRRKIYEDEGCIDKVEIAYLKSWKEVMHIEKMKKMYPWV